MTQENTMTYLNTASVLSKTVPLFVHLDICTYNYSFWEEKHKLVFLC